MVKNEDDLIAVVSSTIRQWFSKLPATAAIINEEFKPAHEYIYEVDIRPSKPAASSIRIGIRSDETFDVLLGKNISFNEISLSVDLLLEVCESVCQGYLKEEVLEWRGKVFRSKGILKFPHEIQWQWLSPKNEVEKMISDQWVSNRGSFMGLFGIGYKRLIEYQPWINERGESC